MTGQPHRSGAPWIDLVALRPALHLDDGPPPPDIFAAPPQDVAPILLLSTPFWHRSPDTSLAVPAPDTTQLATVRHFQAAQGTIARQSLAERLSLH